jgi:hypothetical protein
MKKQRRERRGRKVGDGVIQNIDTASSSWTKRLQLTYGRTHGDHIAEVVRWFRNWRSMIDDCERTGDKSRRQFIDSCTKDFIERLQQQMINALWDFKPDWFQKMADIIILERAASGGESYPLHAALLLLAGVPSVNRTDTVYPERGDVADRWKKLPRRYTISQICDLLEKQGMRPSTQGDDAWRVIVRRACNQIGFPILPSKPGRKHK